MITGIEQAGAALKELDAKVQKTIVRRGVRVGCKIWLEAARGEAPVQSGKTKKNIKIRNGKAGQGKFALNVGVNAKDFAGPTFYSSFVLFGHKVGSRRLGDKRKEVPANNFLKRAFEEKKEAVMNAATESIAAQIQEQTS